MSGWFKVVQLTELTHVINAWYMFLNYNPVVSYFTLLQEVYKPDFLFIHHVKLYQDINNGHLGLF